MMRVSDFASVDIRVPFVFNQITYLVLPQAYGKGDDLRLPDGTILQPTWSADGRRIESVTQLRAARAGVGLSSAQLAKVAPGQVPPGAVN